MNIIPSDIIQLIYREIHYYFVYIVNQNYSNSVKESYFYDKAQFMLLVTNSNGFNWWYNYRVLSHPFSLNRSLINRFDWVIGRCHTNGIIPKSYYYSSGKNSPNGYI